MIYQQVTLSGDAEWPKVADAVIEADRLAQKYLGQETYPFRQPGEVRVLYRIAPDKVVPFAA